VLGRLLYVSLTPQCLINEVHSTKGMSNKSSLDGVIEIAGRYVTDAMLATLQSHYEALRVERGEKTRLDLRELSPEDQERAALDVSFYSQNPHLPLENLCSKLNNYDPKNDSQRELLEYVGKLAEFPDLSKPAGIWAHGQAGVGKSHIAVALTKEFMRRGYQPNFVQFGANNKLMTPNLAPQQVWILDDFNSPYGMDRDTFVRVSLNAHNTGGRMFVTSNMDYDQFMEKLHGIIGDADAKRYFDRIKGMFKVLNVVGESNRQQTAWYNP